MKKKSSVTESKYNHYNILNLTSATIAESTTASEDDYSMICSYCEIAMTRGKNNYFCMGCGLVKEDDADIDTTAIAATTKRREQTGPRIPARKPGQSGIMFKNIRYPQSYSVGPPNKHRSKLQEFFDAEDEQSENMLKAGGCIIADNYEEIIR